MGVQGDLFPNARARDPRTSREAGDWMTTSGKRMKDVEIVAWMVKNYPGSTGREYAAHYKYLDYESIHKRLPDAERLGLIRRAGDRRCSVTGRKATLWWPV